MMCEFTEAYKLLSKAYEDVNQVLASLGNKETREIRRFELCWKDLTLCSHRARSVEAYNNNTLFWKGLKITRMKPVCILKSTAASPAQAQAQAPNAIKTETNNSNNSNNNSNENTSNHDSISANNTSDGSTTQNVTLRNRLGRTLPFQMSRSDLHIFLFAIRYNLALCAQILGTKLGESPAGRQYLQEAADIYNTIRGESDVLPRSCGPGVSSPLMTFQIMGSVLNNQGWALMELHKNDQASSCFESLQVMMGKIASACRRPDRQFHWFMWRIAVIYSKNRHLPEMAAAA